MDELAWTLAKRGHRVVAAGEPVDLRVLNMCAATHVAARKSRKLIRQLRRQQPGAVLVATGCLVELEAPEAAPTALGVDLIVGNLQKDRLADILEERGLLRDGDPVPAADATEGFLLPAQRTRAFVKVQDGCDNRCTFCIVTVARGAGRSRPLDAVVEHVRRLVELDYREAVLSGVHLGSYGNDLDGDSDLAQLVQRLLRHTGIERLRLSSLEPWDLTPSFFDSFADLRLQPHLHLPLQSGCDETLTRMARRTSQDDFAALVRDARSAVPGLSITTDIMVGFPGETETEFETSLDFVREMEFSRLHVFRYSSRQGTAAARMPAQVDPSIVRHRSNRMHALGAELERGYLAKQINSEASVLWEHAEPAGDGEGIRWSGLTGNFVRLLTSTHVDRDLRNLVLPTQLRQLVPGGILGETEHSLAARCHSPLSTELRALRQASGAREHQSEPA